MGDFDLTSPQIKISEDDVERACLDLVKYHGYWPIRQHVGRYIPADKEVLRVLKAAGVRFRIVTMGQPGLPDWAFLHGERPGFMLEAKRPGGKLSAEQERMIFVLRECQRLEVVAVDSVLTLEAWLADHERSP